MKAPIEAYIKNFLKRQEGGANWQNGRAIHHSALEKTILMGLYGSVDCNSLNSLVEIIIETLVQIVHIFIKCFEAVCDIKDICNTKLT